VAVAEGTVIGAADLPASIRSPRLLPGGTGEDIGTLSHPAESVGARRGEVGEVPRLVEQGEHGDPRQSWSLADVEKEHISLVLARHRGNATGAARQLGISRTTLWRKLREYGLRRTGH
jgi:transcriptional regulator of acetoin/glycerol metabolism